MQKTFFYLILLIISSVLVISCNNGENKNLQTTMDTTKLGFSTNDFFQKKDYSKAILGYDALLKIDSFNAEYYFKRGYSKSMLLNDDNGAISDFLKAIHNNYRNKHSAYLNIGMLYRSRGAYDSAIFYYNECLKLDPGNIKAKKAKYEVEILNNIQ